MACPSSGMVELLSTWKHSLSHFILRWALLQALPESSWPCFLPIGSRVNGKTPILCVKRRNTVSGFFMPPWSISDPSGSPHSAFAMPFLMLTSQGLACSRATKNRQGPGLAWQNSNCCAGRVFPNRRCTSDRQRLRYSRYNVCSPG